MRVEVVYAEPERQIVVAVTLPPGATVADALVAACDEQQGDPAQRAALRAILAEAEGEPAMGIFGRRCSLDDPVQDLDQVALYRPLAADAKTARRRRAQQQRDAEK